MAGTIHLIVDAGPDKGREISIPEGGARLGRSDKNDVVLNDPKLSRHHCRFFFKTDDGLCVSDLGSSNHTVVNDHPAQETRLTVGDRVTVGDTVLRVLHNGLPSGNTGRAKVDLGLHPPRSTTAKPIFGTKRLLVIAAVVTAAAIAVPLLKSIPHRPAKPTGGSPALPPSPASLVIEYEKVQADGNSIFRYHLELNADGVLAIGIDDTGNTHLQEERKVDGALLQELASFIEDAGFFTLADEYVGLQPNVLDELDLTVTLGHKVHRTRVRNRVEPDIFRRVRERIEKFGQVELGLWAIQFSPEKLLGMAHDSYLLGKKLFDEREVKHSNLASAIRSFQEADFYLKTVDPKPDYYADMLAGIADCKQILHDKYINHNFEAERAIRLRQWEDAAHALKVLCEMIPDRADPRHEEARTKLLEVQNRLDAER